MYLISIKKPKTPVGCPKWKPLNIYEKPTQFVIKKSWIDKHQNIGEAAWDSVENMSWNFPEI